MKKVRLIPLPSEARKIAFLILKTQEVRRSPRVWRRILNDLAITPLIMELYPDKPHLTKILFYRWDMVEILPGEHAPVFVLDKKRAGFNDQHYRLKRHNRVAKAPH